MPQKSCFAPSAARRSHAGAGSIGVRVSLKELPVACVPLLVSYRKFDVEVQVRLCEV